MKVVKEIGCLVPISLIGKRVKVTGSEFDAYRVGDIYSVVEGIGCDGKVYPKLLKKDQNGIWSDLVWPGFNAEFVLVEYVEEQLELFV